MAGKDVILGLISALLGFLGQLAWRAAIPRGGELSLTWLLKLLVTNKLVALGLALYAASTLAWLAALRVGELSKLYPLISINYALILVAGHVAFGETLTLAKVAGVALVTAGVLVIAITG